jgi:leucine dehydrogenase
VSDISADGEKNVEELGLMRDSLPSSTMKIFDLDIEGCEHQRVVKCEVGEKNLTAIIAIHDTTLGPSLGGTRMWPYTSESDAIQDVLKLSRDMTFKATAAGLKLGGGKSVIIGDPRKDKTEKLFRDFGKFIESLKGQYIASEDVGTEVADIELMRTETKHAVGTDLAKGGSGDPSPMTALGVFQGMRACLEKVYGTDDFSNRTIAIQGAGKVGSYLAELLINAKAKVIVTDVDTEKLSTLQEGLDITTCIPDEIYDYPCDIFSPCALGGTINHQIIPGIRTKIISGGANNQLESPDCADELHNKNILYAPDFVINAGGLISVSSELAGFIREEVEAQVKAIHKRVTTILDNAVKSNSNPLQEANRLVANALKR